jgi:hypothetical protein
LALHVTVLIGFRNRVSVLLSWIYSYLFFRRGSRLITGLSSEQIAELSADAMKGATATPPGPAANAVCVASSVTTAQNSLTPDAAKTESSATKG